MANISNVQKEREIIGLFLNSLENLEYASNNDFNLSLISDEFNRNVLEIIFNSYLKDNSFFPSVSYVVDKLDFKDEKDKRATNIKLSRYKKMIKRELEESQYKKAIDLNLEELKDLAIKRRVIHVIRNGLDEIDLPAKEFLSTITRSLVSVELESGSIKEVGIYTGFKNLKAEMIEQKEKGIEFGFKVHLRDIDKMIQDNIAKKTLTYIVGRPSNYKTGFALNIGVNMAKNGTPVAFFSHEMDGPAVYRRILSRVAGIEMNKIKKPDTLTTDEWIKIDKAIDEVQLWPFYVVDAANLNIAEIPSIIATLKNNYGVEVIIEDYFQLIRTKKNTIPTEEGEFAEISEELRMIAKEFDVAMIALSQANRKCEARDDKRPTLQDIRNTGKAEQDAHNIFYVYRDEFYYHSQSEVPNHMEFGALKIREGELKRCLLHFNGAKATLSSCDPLILIDRSIEYVGGGGILD